MQREFSISKAAQRTKNPIRKIVDRLQIQNPQKQLITLALGDPTVFGNLKTSEQVNLAMIDAINSGKANGYPNAIGTLEARAAIAKKFTQDLTEEVC